MLAVIHVPYWCGERSAKGMLTRADRRERETQAGLECSHRPRPLA